MGLEFKYKFSGEIKNGIFDFKDRERDHFKQIVKAQADQDIELIIQVPEKDRSDQQRKYYYGVIVKRVCELTGYDKDDQNEIFAKMFLKFEIKLKDGRIEEFYRRPSSLNTKESEAFHEQCRKWAIEELNLYIPLPNEVEGQYDYH